MFEIFAVGGHMWYLFPLIISVSLVYGATRHEHIVPILQHSYRLALWTLSFMAVIFLIVLVVSWSL